MINIETYEIEIVLSALVAYLGLCIGYHMSRAFRDIDSALGKPGFVKWLIEAIKRAVHHHDIGIAIAIAGISIFMNYDPFTSTNIGLFIIFMGFAAYWDDKKDSPPQDLVVEMYRYLKMLLGK